MMYIAIVLAYLFGSISFAIIVSKIMQMEDPRTYGSKNPGATNVLRSGNKYAAAITLLGDFLKGLVVILLAKHFFVNLPGSFNIVALCGIFVVIGHIYPIFFKFRGGKGVATSLGVIFGFNLYLALCLAFTWVIIFKLSKISSLAAIVSILLSPFFAYLFMGNSAYFGATLVIVSFVFYKHKANVLRLVRGNEHKF